MHQVINTKSITEEKCGQSMQQMLNVVLSRVRTLSGLYLVKPIDMEQLFKPSSELKKYIENARQKETDILEKRKRAMALLNWL
jgi:hypothetical protein